MPRKNKRKDASTSGTETAAPASTDPPSEESPPQSNLPTQPASSSVSVSCNVPAESASIVSTKASSGFKAVTESPSTIMSSMKDVAITSPVAESDSDDSEGKDRIDVKIVTKSNLDILGASLTSGDPGPSGESLTSGDPGPSGESLTSGDPGPSGECLTSGDSGPSDKKKRDPLNSPESSHDASSVKKRKCSREESMGSQPSTPSDQAVPEQSLNDVISNKRYNVSTPDGDYYFYGPRREFTVVNLKISEVVDEPSPINEGALSPNYLMLARQSKDSSLITDYISNHPSWWAIVVEESALRKHQMRYLYYISEEKTKICASGADAVLTLPDNIEIGIHMALEEAVDKIRDNLIYRTRCEEDHVFNQEFYCSRNAIGYKPPFSNTEMFQQIPASECVIKLAILLLALADAALENFTLVVGIGYCYVAHRMITGFRLLSLLEQPYNVLDHYIRQRVSAAVYALELYTFKDSVTDEKAYDEVCACFTDITSILSTMTANRTSWQAHVSFHDPSLVELPFLVFIERMTKPRTQWTIDSTLAWTTDVISAIRTARQVAAVLKDGESHDTTAKVALVSLKKHYATLRDFKIDLKDSESKHVEALVARFRGLTLAPFLECIKDHKEADEMATQIADDLSIAIEAEICTDQPNPVYFEQLLEDRMVHTLFRLFYHMWETQKPKHVTRIRHKLLGIGQAAMTLIGKYGNGGKFPALVALSSIMYLDYTCGMVSKASEISIKKARTRCHEMAKDHLAGYKHCKNTCLNLITFKMEEVLRSISEEDKETEEFKFEVCCRILKIATLAYPVLSYFSGIASVDQVDFPEVEKPADESYKSMTRKFRPLENGQKLLYLSVPDNMNRTYRASRFLKLGNETDANSKRMMGAVAADGPDKTLESDSDEDDTEEDKGNPSTEEEKGNSNLFLSNLPPSLQRDASDSSPNRKSLPTRGAIADALEKFTRPTEAVAVMLEPLRSVSPSPDDVSVARLESETSASPSTGLKTDQIARTTALQKMEEFKPIGLKNFYKEISNDKKGDSQKTFDFESSKLEEVFAKTYIPISTGEVEENFLESLRIVLRFLLVNVNQMLACCRGDFDKLRKRHWKRWVERIVLLTNLLKERRLTLQENHRLHEVMHNFCVILGFPIRIFTDPETC